MPEPIEQQVISILEGRAMKTGNRGKVEAILDLLTTARREGAEQGWDECVAASWEANELAPNPYRADKIAKGDDE